MKCKVCGAYIPDDSVFCTKCGSRNNVEIEIEAEGKKVNLNKPRSDNSRPSSGSNTPRSNNPPAANNYAPAEIKSELKCPKCGKAILPEWTRCINCGAYNPFNNDIKPVVNQTIVTPEPKVIVKEERTVIKEHDGCGSCIGEIIGSIIFFGLIGSFLMNCTGCL